MSSSIINKTKLSLDQQTIIIKEAAMLTYQNYHNQNSFEICQDRLIMQEKKIYGISVQLEIYTANDAIINFYFNLIVNNQQYKTYIATILPKTNYYIFRVKDDFCLMRKMFYNF